MSRVLLLILATSLAAGACVPNAAGTRARQLPAREQAGADTLRGVVRIVGAEPATSIALDTGAGATAVLSGERIVLEQLAGLEVTVWGRRPSSDRFDVARVAVRALGSVPAVDGVLQRSGDQYELVTASDERLPLPFLPDDLRAHVGARIWVAGPLDRSPEAYGVIRQTGRAP